jgi:uncharacterized damage-inducible protein DinB
MLRRIADFQKTWAGETAATLKIFRALTDASLAQVVGPEGRSLGRLGAHITETLPEMMGHAGLQIGLAEAPEPKSAAQLVAAFEVGARAVGESVAREWTDAMLAESVPMYGETWTRGEVLMALIVHQAHHRGQMTVLMRQAGLKVPGIYGPAREEWAAMGMPAQP